jgi:PD-(D/E)XK endonuclease
MLTTDQKGNIAEVAIALAARKLGIDVYWPIGEGGRYDLIFDLGGTLNRVQCKWAPRQGEVVVIRCYSARRNRDGLVRRIYTEGEIDAYAAYCEEIDRCFFLPYNQFVGRTQIQLRLSGTSNNQKLGINWAADFDFAARLCDGQGAVAQLGERRHGMPKATGSSPVGSTFTSLARQVPRATTSSSRR